MVGAVAEALRLHLLNHVQHPLLPLWLALRKLAEVGHLGRGEQHRRGVGTGSHTRSTTDARRRIHRGVGYALGHGDDVGVGCTTGPHRDVPTGLDDTVQRAAVYHQVSDHWKRFGAPRLDPHLIAVVEAAHVKLARRGRRFGSVRYPIDHHSARAADAFPAVVFERYGVLARFDQLFVDHVEHLQERHVG